MSRRHALPLSLLAVSALALAGCSTGDGGAGSGEEAQSAPIVASTNVYASLAQALVGDAAQVGAVIDDPTKDPHAYEATARDRLTVQDADLVIRNGGGYDAFMDALIGDGAAVVTAVEFSHDYPGEGGHDHAEGEEGHEHAEGEEHDGEEEGHEGHHHIEGFNEHVWYDPHTMIHLVEAIAEEIGHELPDLVDAAELEGNRDELIGELEAIEARLDTLAQSHDGEGVFLTEPIGGYLATAAGLQDVTPEGFAESVEEGQDVPPATLLEATRVIESGDVAVVLVNAQTGGSETEQVIAAAKAEGVPVVELSELLLDGETYIEWMTGNVDALEGALS